jgi:NitT/TauT family transport system substrate-binding protein
MSPFKKSPFLAFIAFCWLVGFGAGAQAAELQKLELMTEWAPHGFHAPFYLAQQKGWFKDAGIEVTIKDGRGSASTVGLLASGQADIAYAHFSAAALARAKGLPVKVIATVMRKNTIGLIMKKGAGITSPVQLRGKTVLYAATTIEGPLFDGVLDNQGMTRGDLTTLVVDASSKVASVLGGKGDAAVAPVPYYLALVAGKSELDTVLFSDFGSRMLDMSIIAREDTIRDKPAAVAAFIAVMSRAYEYTLLENHIDEAVKAMATIRPNADVNAFSATNMFKFHAQFIQNERSKGKPVGFISQQDVQESIDTMRKAKLLDVALKADDLYSPVFNPK